MRYVITRTEATTTVFKHEFDAPSVEMAREVFAATTELGDAADIAWMQGDTERSIWPASVYSLIEVGGEAVEVGVISADEKPFAWDAREFVLKIAAQPMDSASEEMRGLIRVARAICGTPIS